MLIQSRPPQRLLTDFKAERWRASPRRLSPVRLARVAPTGRTRSHIPGPSRVPRGHHLGLLDRTPGARHLPPGWPLRFLLVGFPLWWVMGLSTFIFPIMAIPMFLELRRRRPIRIPPAFWLWALFLVWLNISLAMFNASPPGTHGGSSSGRLISIVFTEILYAGITITLLYVGNLSIASVPQAVIARWMGYFFLTVAAGGYLGILAAHLSFPSVVELILPHHLRANTYVRTLVHPVASQVQSVLGATAGRPAAPFGYTNDWGNALGILLVWFIAAWVIPARGRRKVIYAALVTATIVPVVLSLNRGLWIGVIFTIAWLGLRQVLHGRIGVLLAGLCGLLIAGLLFLGTPLNSVINQRLEHGGSNSIRTFVASQSITAAKHSPIIGYGSNRHTNGSSNSIAVGKTSTCATCGDVPTGSTGQLWAIMFNQGVGGLVWYFGFFAAGLWIYRRERGAINEAALVTIALVFIFMWFYIALPAAPTLSMIAVAVLWRARQQRLDGVPTVPTSVGAVRV